MADNFVGQILLFPFNFPPRDFAFCRGQLLPIAQNTALFSLLGTTYGGDGRTTFALPDLQGRVPLGFGQGPGLSNHTLGEAAGQETVALNLTQMPQHTHAITNALTATARCKNGPASQVTPVGNVPASEAAGTPVTYSNALPDANLNAAAITIGGGLDALPAGSGVAHENRQPYLAMSYCIALAGVFPSRQ